MYRWMNWNNNACRNVLAASGRGDWFVLQYLCQLVFRVQMLVQSNEGTILASRGRIMSQQTVTMRRSNSLWYHQMVTLLFENFHFTLTQQK